ncbi:MAG: hypothetical protein ACI9LG_003521, partial [Moritella dasanensis]
LRFLVGIPAEVPKNTISIMNFFFTCNLAAMTDDSNVDVYC